MITSVNKFCIMFISSDGINKDFFLKIEWECKERFTLQKSCKIFFLFKKQIHIGLYLKNEQFYLYRHYIFYKLPVYTH